MKRRVKLTESDLHKIIKESVKRVLKEGGHLYHKDDDGNVRTNSKETYRGVPGSVYIWHGAWSDPEIIYKNHSINYWDAEESLWNAYKDFCEENGIEPTEDKFDEYVDKYEDVESHLNDLVWASDGCP